MGFVRFLLDILNIVHYLSLYPYEFWLVYLKLVYKEMSVFKFYQFFLFFLL